MQEAPLAEGNLGRTNSILRTNTPDGVWIDDTLRISREETKWKIGGCEQALKKD